MDRSSPIVRGAKYTPNNLSDQLTFFNDAARLRVPAFSVISRVQDFTPAEQILGTAVALIAMTEAAGLRLDRVLNIAHNAMRDADAPFTTHVRAVKEYAKHEIGRV